MKTKHAVLNDGGDIELTEQKYPIIADQILEKNVAKDVVNTGGMVTLQFYGLEKKLKKMGVLK
jgi:hypothetical protein